jgi:hypothetical protein
MGPIFERFDRKSSLLHKKINAGRSHVSNPVGRFGLPENIFSSYLTCNIAEVVAAMTEDDPAVGVKKLIDNSISS